MTDRTLQSVWLFTGCVLALCGLFLLPDSALAAASDLSTQSFRCSGGKASGELYSSGQCPTSLTMTNFFSFMVCNFEQLSSNVMGHMYCGFVESMTPIVWRAVTLAILLFGISFTIGLTSLSRGGAIMFVIKLAFVVGFATNADLLIGVAYKFFISGISEGVTIVLSHTGNEKAKTGSDVYQLMDNFLQQVFHFATDSIQPPPKEGTAETAAAVSARCKNAVFAVLVVLGLTFPMVTYLGIMLIVRIALTFFRICFGYIYALVGITFLMVLAPIFLCFYLFRKTQGLFDKWLGYIVSFTLQIVLLFAFMTFILSLNVSHLMGSLPNIIVFNAKAAETTSFRFPWQYCTLCDFKIVDKTQGSENSSGEQKELPPDSPDLLEKGQLQCKDSPPKPIDVTFMAAPKQGKPELNALVNLAGTGLISLVVLGWIIERLLTMLPYLAQRISGGMGGASYATQLGGVGGVSTGARGVPMPGDSLIRDFEAGFNRGYGAAAFDGATGIESTTGKLGSSVSATASGIKQGFSVMASGRLASSGKDSKGNPIKGEEIPEAGVGAHFMRWLTDPGRFDR